MKILIVLGLAIGTIYSLGPVLRSLGDGPELTPLEFEEVMESKPKTAVQLIKKIDDHRVRNKIDLYGSGKNTTAIRKGIEDDTEDWLDLITDTEIMSINWYDEELPSRIEGIMLIDTTDFADDRNGKLQQYFVYLDDQNIVLGWRKK